jgi:ribosomal protein S18 acetylase RimI-like enzyme
MSIEIQTIEEHALNAWPALDQVLMDGWILRFSRGYTRRANSVQPLYPGSRGIYEKILACESQYRDANLPVIFRIPPTASPGDLDELLADRGYGREAPTSVQSIDLDAVREGSDAGCCITDEPAPAWFESYADLQGMSAVQQSLFSSILGRVRCEIAYGSLSEGGAVRSVGMAVRHNGWVGLFGVVTDPSVRGRGYGRRVVESLLTDARVKGAGQAYLQVTVANDPALALYARLGFREVYRYWYRVRRFSEGRQPS